MANAIKKISVIGNELPSLAFNLQFTSELVLDQVKHTTIVLLWVLWSLVRISFIFFSCIASLAYTFTMQYNSHCFP